jgi:hypothetical protein
MTKNCSFTPKCDKCGHQLEACGKPGYYHAVEYGYWRCKDHWPATEEYLGNDIVWYRPIEEQLKK